MKRLIVLFAFVVFGLSPAFSQGDLKLGFNAGIPVGDISDYSDLQAGVDAAYLLNLMGIVEVGPMVGYSHFVGEDDLDNIQFVPVAASGRIGLPMVFIGLDLGYGLALQDGIDGGVFYRPKVGFGIGLVNLIASYSGINTDGTDFSSLNLGIELSL